MFKQIEPKVLKDHYKFLLLIYFKNDFLCCHILFSIYPGSLRVAACLDTCPSVCLESELKHPSNSPVDEKLSMLVAPHNDGLPRPRHSHSHLSMEIQLFLAPAGAQRVSFSDPKPIWSYPTINVRAKETPFWFIPHVCVRDTKWRARNCFSSSIHLLSSSEDPLKVRPESC